MINEAGSVTSGDTLDLEYHGDKYDLVTKRGAMLALRRNGSAIRLTLNGTAVVVLTEDEADGLAYNLACASLASASEREAVPPPVGGGL
jgi:hypothetical protein